MSTTEYYETYMKQALVQANIARGCAEVPVGAVIVRGDEVIAVGRNRRESDQNALMHAEIEAIHEACRILKTWRLSDCTLFVTLEPCPMCAGAIINSRIGKVVVGARDAKAGACGSVINLFACPFNHRPDIIFGILEQECAALLKDFFRTLRK